MTCEQSTCIKGAFGVSNFDPYLLPDANVLDNCFREKNPGSLQEHETFFSGLRIRELIAVGASRSNRHVGGTPLPGEHSDPTPLYE